MPDPLSILAFKVAPGQFDIASGQAFISIRDQAVRVRTLLGEMNRAGLLDPPDIHVLVVGAGYAGVSAALWLADHDVQTTLVDAAPRAFDLQHRCTTRHLSLTQYDWPARHYDQHDYPGGLYPGYVEYDWLTTSHAHLSTIRSDTAAALAADWETDFKRHAAPLGSKLTWKHGTRVMPKSVKAMSGRVQVDLEDVATGSIAVGQTFDYVLFAVGFGTDGGQVSTGPHTPAKTTPAFWDNDFIATATPPSSIVISGGGDGALQDFLRAVANPTFETAERILAQIYATMRSYPGAAPDVEHAWSSLREAIAYADTQAGRASTWLGETHPEIWDELTRHYLWAIRKYLDPLNDELFRGIESVVDRPGGPSNVTLAFPSNGPGKVYGLNRFLFVLFNEYFDYVGHTTPQFFDHSPRPTPGLSLASVRVLRGHRTDLAASSYDTVARSYDVVLHPAGVSSPPVTLTADELLIRHGTRKPPPLAVRVGRLPLRLELGRIPLPFAALF